MFDVSVVSNPKHNGLRTKPEPTIAKAKNRISSVGKTEKNSRMASERCGLCTRCV